MAFSEDWLRTGEMVGELVAFVRIGAIIGEEEHVGILL